MYVPTKEDGLRTPLFIVMVTVAMSLFTKVRHLLLFRMSKFDLSKHRLNIEKYQIACLRLIYLIFQLVMVLYKFPLDLGFAENANRKNELLVW